jgi:hypothetical protein|tara:strand:- start:180 stop:1061 length:882 start_codon:yes stop_codon:yes gene_type:complete
MANTITNKHNLPQTLVNLAESRDYSRGNSHRSITQLIDAPQISVLRMINENRITEDVVDTFWANLGSALHHITEKGADDKHLVEERLFVDVEDWTISGAIDVQRLEDDNSITIMDYKFTSVWAVKNPKLDWERQLNCYAYLVEANKKVKIKELQIICFLRDWNRNNAKRDMNYPQQQIVVVPIKLWDFEERSKYVADRVRTHQEALQDYMNGKDMAECTFEEMWKREDTYAVKKKKNKRALKVFEIETDAKEFAKEKGEEYEVEFREGVAVRCEDNYCKVNQWCPQYQQVLKG